MTIQFGKKGRKVKRDENLTPCKFDPHAMYVPNKRITILTPWSIH